MKKNSLILVISLLFLGSCSKYLDVNTNPNQATSATPEILLPQTITATASTLNTYNTYGSLVGGFMANAGGIGGFGSTVTYNYSSSDYSGLWSSAYNNLEDYQQIITLSSADSNYRYFNSAARIMRAMDFQLLVDQYNDIPYIPQALQGLSNLVPTYTKAEDVYTDLAKQLDSAIQMINAGQTQQSINPNSNIKSLGSLDPMFGGNMDSWKKLANTLKLRLFIHAYGKINFSNTTFDPIGFLTTDALINPGYTNDNGKQNPEWAQWVYTITGTQPGGANDYIATKWALSWYNGTNLDDPRGYVIYKGFPSTAANQLGFESSSVPSSPSAGGAWFSDINTDATSTGNSIGVMKGPNQGFPLMLAAESYFLQSEAVLKNIPGVSGSVEDLFNKGILASFNYLYLLPDDKSFSSDPDWNSPSGDMEYYQEANSDNYLANIDLAANDNQRLEAIITQKYIALNMIAGHEAWNEYRRTHYPTIVNGSSNATETFASLQSVSTRPDKLPTRLLYPTSETNYNSNNVPKQISPFTSFIFWALQ